MRAGDHPRCVVTSREAPTPQRLYADRSGARGHGDNESKAVQHALHRDRTAATSVRANAMRLWLAGAASALPHAWRPHTLQPTALAPAQPATLIRTLLKSATQVKQYKGRLLLQRPRSCPVQAL